MRSNALLAEVPDLTNKSVEWRSMLSGQFGWIAVWIAAIGIVGIFLRQIVPFRKQAAEAQAQLRTAEAQLRADLMRRVEKLEEDRDRERLRYESELMIERHRAANVTAAFDAFLMLVKANPDKVAESVVMIEEMRARQMLAEAEEKSIIRAAIISAAGGKKSNSEADVEQLEN